MEPTVCRLQPAEAAHQILSPKWYENVDDALFSSQARADTLAEIYSSLESTISALDAFLLGRLNSFDAAEAELCQSFGFSTKSKLTPKAAAAYDTELRHLIETFSQFHEDLKELQWFLTVNTEAVERIFAKLARRGHAEASHLIQRQTRWNELQSGWKTKLKTRIGTVSPVSFFLSAQQDMPGESVKKSLFLTHVVRQRPCPRLITSALYRLLDEGNTDGFFQSLISEAASLAKREPNFLALVRDLLKFSALFAPEHFKALLALLRPPEQPAVKHEVLRWTIIAVGRRHKPGPPLGESTRHQAHEDPVGAHNFLDVFKIHNDHFSDMLLEKDDSGRLLLHYAASYRMSMACEVLVQALKSRPSGPDDVVEAVTSPDKEGLSPLHLAVMNGCTSSSMYLINAIVTSAGAEVGSSTRAMMGDVLQLALKHQNDEMVHSLLQAHADVSFQSRRGETALHIAAQIGRFDYAVLILDAISEQGAEVDVPDTTQGMTPLFIACLYGHYDIVEILLQAGSSQHTTDHLGWTAKEHATFRGHLGVTQLFKASDVPGFDGGPASFQEVMKASHTSLYCEGSQKVIIASLGTNQINRVVTALNLSKCSSKHTSGNYESQFFALEVSAPGSVWKPRRVRLPILEDTTNDPFVFPIPDSADARLVFRILCSKSLSNEEYLIGCGTALLESNTHQFGVQRQSLVRDQTVPILDKKTMELLGTITFTSFIVTSFPHLQTPQPIDLARNSSTPPILVGHRGLGQNVKTHEYLQLGENTVESFLSAARLGASFVEFDVQVTRDLQAVAFHDFSLSESGTDVAVHDLTLEQFLHASKIQSPHGNPLSVLGQAHSRTEPGRPRSRSLGRGFEAGAIQTRDRMKHTVDFKQKGFKPNTRGDFIQDSFATLREILVELPPDVGCDIEISL